MKIKFTQQPNVFCDANYTYTHLNATYMAKDKTWYDSQAHTSKY
jgi:hypothetical protein